MTDGKNYYAADTVAPFVSAFINRRLSFVKRCDLTRMIVLYTESVSEVLSDQKGDA